MSLCVFLSTCISTASRVLLDFLHNSVQRHRGIFWLHLHVKWRALLCGREVPPDSPSPVACQTEPARSPHSFLPAGVGHDSTVCHILRSCQSFHCPTGVNLLKSSRLARTNTAHAQRLPSARQTDKRHGRDIKKAHTGLLSFICWDRTAPATV